jgi:hypothetical protein
MHSAASAYSLITGDTKFLEICYLLKCGIMAFLQQVYSVCYNMSLCVKICKKRTVIVIKKIVIIVLKEDKVKYIVLTFVKEAIEQF